MYKLRNNWTKILKIFHIFGVCCWFGGAMSMLFLNINNNAAVKSGMLYGINYPSHTIDMWIVVYFGVYICLITGFLYSFMTPWSFFKYKWVTLKWIFTILCFMSGWFFLGRYENNMLQLSQQFGNEALRMSEYIIIRNKHLALTVVQISILFFMIAISILKPWKNK